jgi:predicted RNA binding protein YcfA (HicA-like mRNA interferase family)
MAYSYDDFRTVLRKAGFTMTRSKKHETWRKKLDDGTECTVRVSHQHGRDIPAPLLSKMLRQAGLTRSEFDDLLKDA